MTFKDVFLRSLKDGAVRRAICSATASCSGGGAGSVSTVNGVPPDPGGNIELTLQEITTAGNTTTNPIEFPGGPDEFARVDYSGDGFRIIYFKEGFSTTFQLVLDPDTGLCSYIEKDGLPLLEIFDPSVNNEPALKISGRASAQDGVDPLDLVTKQQLDATASVSNQIINSDSPIAVLTPGTVYTYTGSNPTTWGLPASNTAPGLRIFIINMGAGTVTVNAASTGNIYANGSAVDSIDILAGTSNVFIDNNLVQFVIA